MNDEPAVQDLRCPNCGGGVTITLAMNGTRGICSSCGETGNVGYFQPDPKPILEDVAALDRYITIKDEDLRLSGAHVAAVLCEMTELATTENLELAWDRLRVIPARDEHKAATTFAVVVPARRRPPTGAVSTSTGAVPTWTWNRADDAGRSRVVKSLAESMLAERP